MLRFRARIRYLEKGELLPEGNAPEDWGMPITSPITSQGTIL